MQYKTYFITFLLAALTVLSGCQKWLDINPKSRVSERILLENEQGFKDALIGVYVKLASRELYAKEFTMGFMDVLAMNYNVTSSNHPYYFASNYQYDDINVQQKINAFWAEGYRAIANLNNLLAAIDDKKAVFSGNNYQQIKGEALALRALVHFDLLRAFGPMPTKGMQQPAIPYVKTFDMTIRPILTLGEVLEACLLDLTTARSLLESNKTVVNGHQDIFLAYTRNHMNYWASTGLMARVLLYQGDHEAAYAKAMEVIDTERFPFVTPEQATDPTSMNRVFSMEHLFCLYVSNLTDINAELFTSSLFNAYLTASNEQLNERFEVSSGGSTDYRYLVQWQTEGASATKFPAKYWQGTANLYEARNRVPILKIAEMYYIAAESSADKAEKTSLLNRVRAHRGLAALPADLTTSQLEEEIFKAYKKEFIQEGQLFYYYKRFGKNRIDGFPSPVSEQEYVLPMPDDEVEFNPSANENN